MNVIKFPVEPKENLSQPVTAADWVAIGCVAVLIAVGILSLV